MSELETSLFQVIQVLNESVWRGRVDGPSIELWLKGFGDDGQAGSDGRAHALYLLSRFMFFGDDEVRELLRALYRDNFRYPAIAKLRQAANDTRDEKFLRCEFKKVLGRTRFLGMGNPSESGTHLLYYYRQENGLPSDLFISPHQIFDLRGERPALANPAEIDTYVFIDDFCGSGVQGVRYSEEILSRFSLAAEEASVTPRVEYHVLMGTKKGLKRVREKADFDAVKCVLELDKSYKAFGESSRYFRNPPDGIKAEAARELAHKYGAELCSDSLGFRKAQLLLAFIHNTPNNTLPIFWHPGNATKAWSPLFRRYYKLNLASAGRDTRGDHARH